MKRPRAISVVSSTPPRRALLLVTLLLAGSAGAGFALASESRPVQEYAIPTGSVTSVRPTGVGLPQIGETGTVGAGELVSALKKYEESGEYEADLAAVDGAAEAYLNERVAPEPAAAGTNATSAAEAKQASAPKRKTSSHSGKARSEKAKRRRVSAKGKRVCKTSYKPARRTRKGTELYRRVVRCHRAPRQTSEGTPSTGGTTTPANPSSGTTPSGGESTAPAKGKPALVLDIDETSLSNYAALAATGFTEAGVAVGAAAGTDPAIAPTLKLYKDAVKHGVAVFFVTGRPQEISAITESNLEKAGYDEGWAGIAFKPASDGVVEFKAAERKSIEQSGYDIVANVGDQQSDLEGGYADRAFKLPDPFYYIAN